MPSSYGFDRLEKTIARDKKLLFTLCSFILILGIYINLSFFQSSVIGVVASILYFMVNGIFLGHAFFERESAFFRLMFGILLLIMLLGFVGWLAVILYNLDVIRFTLVLVIIAILSSLSNRRVKNKNVA
jgi:hypothetical protein